MEKENKDLLIKDLYSRFPYRVVCEISDGKTTITEELKSGGLNEVLNGTLSVKPYLRPMSSMTEEEKEELENIGEKYFGQALDKQIKECLSSSPKDESRKLEYFASSKIVDYLNKYHFDYRGLIPMGLALEAQEGMYKNE